MWSDNSPIKALRESLDVDLKTAAKACELKEKELHAIEVGKATLTGMVALQLADIYDTSMAEILENHDRWLDLEPDHVAAHFKESPGPLVSTVATEDASRRSRHVSSAALQCRRRHEGYAMAGREGVAVPEKYHMGCSGKVLSRKQEKARDRTPYLAIGRAGRRDSCRFSGQDDLLVRRFPLHPDGPMPFGVYWDLPMTQVPADWLLYMDAQPFTKNWPAVREYVEKHREELERAVANGDYCKAKGQAPARHWFE
jgi:plasmid maintenance system antidote protein VapI